jgi:hypothetical protein
MKIVVSIEEAVAICPLVSMFCARVTSSIETLLTVCWNEVPNIVVLQDLLAQQDYLEPLAIIKWDLWVKLDQQDLRARLDFQVKLKQL